MEMVRPKEVNSHFCRPFKNYYHISETFILAKRFRLWIPRYYY